MGQEVTVNFLFGCNDISQCFHFIPPWAMYLHTELYTGSPATSSELPCVSYTEIATECCKNQSGGHVEKLNPTVDSVQYFNLA